MIPPLDKGIFRVYICSAPNILPMLSYLLNFFYPRTCVSCGNVLLQHEQFLCLHCLHNLPETRYHEFEDSPLSLLFRGRVRVENVGSFLFYKKGNQVQKILHHLKYNGGKEIGSFLGNIYGTQLIKDEKWKTTDLIIPIPLHKKKEKKRGYNQSEWIAKGLSTGMQIPYCPNVLIRSEFTETQTKKSRFHRWENVKEVFQITDINELSNKHILLCDDVLTTGATIEAAIQKLAAVPEIRISVLTLATAQ
ncbi:MAG: ComF family protein [Bacteroidetes bacterium]|nr:ComF family protein [Bacteroidota bacterium]MCL1968535.1 ComF family protein [Bacteroidota bacterium]